MEEELLAAQVAQSKVAMLRLLADLSMQRVLLRRLLDQAGDPARAGAIDGALRREARALLPWLFPSE